MSTEALALLEKYRRKSTMPPCPDELRGLLKDLSDLYVETGRKLSRDQLLREVRSRGHSVGRPTVHEWIIQAGGTPWFTP